MIPYTATALQQNVNNDSTNNMDMSSILLNALYERTLQQAIMSQEVPSLAQHSSLYPATSHQGNNAPSSISFNGKLYALLPIPDQGIGGTADINKVQHSLLSGGRSNIIEQYRDDLSTSNRGNAATSSAVVRSNVSDSPTNRPISRRKGRDSRGPKHRPTIHVPPMAFYSIREPNVNDVLMGRGGRINKHVGNVQLRNIVAARQEEYLSSATGKLDKAYIAADIVASIRLQYHPPGRFLEQNAADHTWYEVGDERAIRKVLQALRENAPEFLYCRTANSTTAPASSASCTAERQTEV